MKERATNQPARGGVGFTGLLLLVFITLKLCGVIQWPWIWVLSPAWIPLAIVLLVLALAFLFAFVATLIDATSKRLQ
jgi:hypothetical protein